MLPSTRCALACCIGLQHHLLTLAIHLVQVDAWLMRAATPAEVEGCAQELRSVREAAAFMVAPAKQALSLEALQQLCPSLSLPQLHRLVTTYKNDKWVQQSGVGRQMSCEAGIGRSRQHVGDAVLRWLCVCVRPS